MGHYDIRGGNGQFVSCQDRTITLVCTLDEICRKPAEKLTAPEVRWMLDVVNQRPAWAIQTLERYGFHGPLNTQNARPHGGQEKGKA